MLAFAGMLGDIDDQEPVTLRELPVTAQLFAYVVVIHYREPSYALYSGTERTYTGSFPVRAADERDAIAQASSRFHSAALASGVGWSRVITGVVCRAA